MSDKFQNFNSPLGQSLEEIIKYLDFIGDVTSFSNETNIFTEILDKLDVDNLSFHKFASIVTCLGKWDKNVGKIVHQQVPEENT